jgi:hypothetical protein
MNVYELIEDIYLNHNLETEENEIGVLISHVINSDGKLNSMFMNVVVYCVRHNSGLVLCLLLKYLCKYELNVDIIYMNFSIVVLHIIDLLKENYVYIELLKEVLFYDNYDLDEMVMKMIQTKLKNLVCIKLLDLDYNMNDLITMFRMYEISINLFDKMLDKHFDNKIDKLTIEKYSMRCRITDENLTTNMKIYLLNNSKSIINRKLKKEYVKSTDSWKLYCNKFNRYTHLKLIELLMDNGIYDINGINVELMNHKNLCYNIRSYLFKTNNLHNSSSMNYEDISK